MTGKAKGLTEAPRSSRRHQNKTCAWCDQTLPRVARYGCAAIYDRSVCWWAPAIAEHGLDEAIRLSDGKHEAGRLALQEAGDA